MPRFFNPFVTGGQQFSNNVNTNTENNTENNQTISCTNLPNCPTIYKECPPIVTCSKQVINQYHITKQPYIHTYHTEVVHHHITQNEFIPNYTCSEVHINESNNNFNNM